MFPDTHSFGCTSTNLGVIGNEHSYFTALTSKIDTKMSRFEAAITSTVELVFRGYEMEHKG